LSELRDFSLCDNAPEEKGKRITIHHSHVEYSTEKRQLRTRRLALTLLITFKNMGNAGAAQMDGAILK